MRRVTRVRELVGVDEQLVDGGLAAGDLGNQSTPESHGVQQPHAGAPVRGRELLDAGVAELAAVVAPEIDLVARAGVAKDGRLPYEGGVREGSAGEVEVGPCLGDRWGLRSMHVVCM